MSYFGGPFAVGSPITAGMLTGNAMYFAPSVYGSGIFGFATPAGQVGWIQINFGGLGGPITYVASAWNTTPGQQILAGQLAVPEPSSLALAGLATLAAGAAAIRQRRKAKAASSTAS